MQTDKWNFRYSYGKDIVRYDAGWRHLQFGIFKVTKKPNEGVQLRRENYKGFIFSIRFWLPWELA